MTRTGRGRSAGSRRPMRGCTRPRRSGRRSASSGRARPAAAAGIAPYPSLVLAPGLRRRASRRRPPRHHGGAASARRRTRGWRRCAHEERAASRRERLRAQLADLKMPGALEALDEILSGVDGGAITPAEAIEPCSARRSRCATSAGCRPPCEAAVSRGEDARRLRLHASSPRSSASRSRACTSSASSSGGRTSSSSAPRASARRTWPSAWPSPPLRAAAASTTARWPISSVARGSPGRRQAHAPDEDTHLPIAPGRR